MDISTIIIEEFIKQGLSIFVGGATAYLVAQKRLHEEKIKLQQEALKLQEQEKEDIRGGLQALLRNTIKHGCKNAIERGWITIDEKEDLLNCVEHYENLGKNGVINDIVEEMRALPTSPKGEEKC